MTNIKLENYIFFRKLPYGRQASLEDINLDQFLKISNYEETIKQLDIYYGIVKRQLLQNQSEITGLFPVLSSDREVL
jgi:phosphorylase kinase alpha/beta subunit